MTIHIKYTYKYYLKKKCYLQNYEQHNIISTNLIFLIFNVYLYLQMSIEALILEIINIKILS